MSLRDLYVPGPGAPDQNIPLQGGLLPKGLTLAENQEQPRKSSLITVKNRQRTTSFVSFDEITTTIKSEHTKEFEENEKGETLNDEKNCEAEGI